MPHTEFENSEYEYKISVPQRAALDFLRTLKKDGRLLPLGDGKNKKWFELQYPDQESHYPAEKVHYDTKDFIVGESHNVLRVRRLTRKQQEKLSRQGLSVSFKQVVKSHGEKDAGGFAREEKKGFIKGRKPDVSAIPDPALRAKFADVSKRKWKEIFTTDTRRIICNVKLGDKPDEYAELALDIGHIRFKNQKKQLPICIFEPEQKKNCTRAQLAAFKDEIIRRVPGADLQTYTNADLGLSVVLQDRPDKLASVLGDRAVDLSQFNFDHYCKPKDDRLGALRDHRKHKLVLQLA